MGKKLTRDEFEKRVQEIFKDTIDLSEYDFINTSTTGLCKCKICGHTWKPKGNTLLNGHGCRKCYDARNAKNKTLPLEDVQKRIDQWGKHVVIIDEYRDTKHRCIAKCKLCEYEWSVRVSDLIRGCGCPKCYTRWTQNRKSKTQFINEMNDLYLSEYEYLIDKDYVVLRDKIKFRCPKHGIVEQLVATHMKGNGCKYCKESGLEKKIRFALINNHFEFTPQYKPSWLGNQSLDFYLNNHNIAIECQGRQHFESISVFGGMKTLQECQQRDNQKKQLCKDNNIKLVYFLDKKYIKFLDEDDIYFTNIEDLITYIQNSELN